MGIFVMPPPGGVGSKFKNSKLINLTESEIGIQEFIVARLLECYSNFIKETYMAIKIDPVSKMKVETESADFISEYLGEKFFCSKECRYELEENPTQFLEDTAHE